MTTQKAPRNAPVSAVVAPGGDIFAALSAATKKAASVKRTVAPGSLRNPTEIGPGVVAQMMGTQLVLCIETDEDARSNAEVTDKGQTILAKAGPGFGRTTQLPGTDLALALYLGVAMPKKGGK